MLGCVSSRRDYQDLSGKFQHFHQSEDIDSNIDIWLMV